MIKQSTVRMIIDTAMTLVSLVMIGGNYFFPWTGVHEILGASLFVLWGVHIALNGRWYGTILKGAYRPFRIMQTAVNCDILVCGIFLMYPIRTFYALACAGLLRQLNNRFLFLFFPVKIPSVMFCLTNTNSAV